MQKLWRLDRASAENDLSAGHDIHGFALDPDPYALGLSVPDDNLFHQHLGQHRQVRPLHGRLQECPGGTAAPSTSDRKVIGAYAKRGGAIEIIILRQTKLSGRAKPRRAMRMIIAKLRDLNLAMAAMILGFRTGE